MGFLGRLFGKGEPEGSPEYRLLVAANGKETDLR